MQAILLSDNAVQVMPLALNANQQGEWVLPLSREWNRAVLVIAGMTPVTTSAAAYQYT
ncbi:MAG: hypothetical protein IPL78_21775, partial [Chloroflexi bacterium]|nr:hypothetical protein [Chloroflexota bacterium]